MSNGANCSIRYQIIVAIHHYTMVHLSLSFSPSFKKSNLFTLYTFSVRFRLYCENNLNYVNVKCLRKPPLSTHWLAIVICSANKLTVQLFVSHFMFNKIERSNWVAHFEPYFLFETNEWMNAWTKWLSLVDRMPSHRRHILLRKVTFQLTNWALYILNLFFSFWHISFWICSRYCLTNLTYTRE